MALLPPALLGDTVIGGIDDRGPIACEGVGEIVTHLGRRCVGRSLKVDWILTVPISSGA